LLRVCFNYHYMPSLLVAMHCFALVIDIMLRITRRTRNKALVMVGYIVVLVLAVSILWCFVYFSPWTYGTSLTTDEHAARVWVKTWFH